ncbi:hypothetical protein BDK51DRAFT_42490 [Blyttiomyces helicus]|uniref:Uncharacterized protein n=1 Tax=Blyttiomyces helicus TaxID=388810 RepID=A0A4P9WAN9_9FUNG|nr:hypothetical protein BDK51DRAFT_42490 [Blyttiomyces helicus]|eukprot:RKO88583.1 hypothetical protein BDK51DRAFT_42490 [Blyttiomyces helicus]
MREPWIPVGSDRRGPPAIGGPLSLPPRYSAPRLGEHGSPAQPRHPANPVIPSQPNAQSHPPSQLHSTMSEPDRPRTPQPPTPAPSLHETQQLHRFFLGPPNAAREKECWDEFCFAWLAQSREGRTAAVAPRAQLICFIKKPAARPGERSTSWSQVLDNPMLNVFLNCVVREHLDRIVNRFPKGGGIALGPRKRANPDGGQDRKGKSFDALLGIQMSGSPTESVTGQIETDESWCPGRGKTAHVIREPFAADSLSEATTPSTGRQPGVYIAADHDSLLFKARISRSPSLERRFRNEVSRQHASAGEGLGLSDRFGHSIIGFSTPDTHFTIPLHLHHRPPPRPSPCPVPVSNWFPILSLPRTSSLSVSYILPLPPPLPPPLAMLHSAIDRILSSVDSLTNSYEALTDYFKSEEDYPGSESFYAALNQTLERRGFAGKIVQRHPVHLVKEQFTAEPRGNASRDAADDVYEDGDGMMDVDQEEEEGEEEEAFDEEEEGDDVLMVRFEFRVAGGGGGEEEGGHVRYHDLDEISTGGKERTQSCVMRK